jgi:non-ribosomal peptide synthetase component F
MVEVGIDRYAELHAGFRWHVPERFNIADVCCTRWARSTPDAVAIRYQREDGSRRDYSYAELDRAADRLAAALRSLDVARGDRVAIVMPQRFETAVAHIALYRLGAVAMPLSMLFGPDALEYRINDSGARLAFAAIATSGSSRFAETRETFSPEHVVEDARQSGLLQCRKCGLVWFSNGDAVSCPEGPHGRPVHVALICRKCDAVVSLADYPAHVASWMHHPKTLPLSGGSGSV